MTDYSLFFGSFHPVLVHLPIGVLAAAFVLHLLSRWSRFEQLYPAVGALYALAAAGGIAAVVSGWALAGPIGASWDGHRWFGLGALGLGVLTAGVTLRQSKAQWTGIGLAVLTLGITGWTGHLGGSLTHGAGHFKQYAPNAFASADTLVAVQIIDPDSVQVYADLVAPVLQEHCVDCHRQDLQRGQLRMDSYAALLKGGKEGDAISAGRRGELWKRISLPPDHPRHMPTRGTPLSYDQLRVVAAWLDGEKDSTLTVKEWAPDETTLAAVERSYRINVRPLPYVDRARPVAVSLEALPAGWHIQPLSAQHTTLVARADDPVIVSAGDLHPFAANVTELDLRQLKNADAFVRALPALPHLTRLDLRDSDVSDAGVSALDRFPHLETLNLTNTQLTEGGLAQLEQLTALRQLYVYGSRISEDALAAFRERQERIDVPERFVFATDLNN